MSSRVHGAPEEHEKTVDDDTSGDNIPEKTADDDATSDKSPDGEATGVNVAEKHCDVILSQQIGHLAKQPRDESDSSTGQSHDSRVDNHETNAKDHTEVNAHADQVQKTRNPEATKRLDSPKHEALSSQSCDEGIEGKKDSATAMEVDSDSGGESSNKRSPVVKEILSNENQHMSPSSTNEMENNVQSTISEPDTPAVNAGNDNNGDAPTANKNQQGMVFGEAEKTNKNSTNLKESGSDKPSPENGSSVDALPDGDRTINQDPLSVDQPGKAYRKPDEQENYVEPLKKNNNKTAGQKGDTLIAVTFHAVVSPAFNLDPTKDTIVASFEPNILGGWKDYCGPMEIVRSSDGYYVAKLKIAIPVHLLRSNQKIQYKYRVLKVSRKKISIWEQIPKTSRGSEHVNRQLFIPAQCWTAPEAEWHQYDGVMHKKPDDNKIINWWNKHVSGTYYRKCLDETVFGAQLMLPNLEQFITGEVQNKAMLDVAEMVDQICYCVKRRFVYEDFDDSDQLIFMKALMEYLHDGILILKRQMEKPSSQVPRSHHLAAALAIIHIIGNNYPENKNLWISHEDLSALCHALLLKDDLSDYKYLEKQIGILNCDFKVDLEKFIGLMNRQTVKQPMWVLVIPLYHCLSHQSKPGIPLKPSAKHTTPEWWGTVNIEKTIDTFQNGGYPRGEHIEQYMKHLGPLLKHMPLLQRTLMAIITYKKLPEDYWQMFSPEVILGNIYADIASGHTSSVEKLPGFMCLLRDILQIEGGRIEALTDSSEREFAILNAEIQSKIVLDLLRVLAKEIAWFTRKFELFTSVIVVLADTIRNWMAAIDPEEQKSQPTVSRCETTVHDLWHIVYEWLRRVLDVMPITTSFWSDWASASITDRHEMEIFTALLNVSFGHEATDKDWRDSVIGYLYGRYTDKDAMQYVDVYCFGDFSKYHPLIDTYFTERAFDAVEDVCNNKADLSGLFSAAKSSVYNSKIKHLLKRVFERMWPLKEQITNKKIIDLVISWPAFIRYLHVFYGQGKEGRISLLDENLQTHMQTALSVFSEVVGELMGGSVMIQQLEWILNNENNLLKVQKAIEDNEAEIAQREGIQELMSTSQILSKVLRWRQRELIAFRDEKQILNEFIGLCRPIQEVDCTEISTKLRETEADLRVNTICQPQEFTKESAGMEDYKPVLIYFGVGEDILKHAREIPPYLGSATFLLLWKEHSKALKKNPAVNTFQAVIDEIWIPASTEFLDICQQLFRGTITFQLTSKYFGSYKNKNDKLKQEFLKMCDVANLSDKWVERRTYQVDQYHCLHRYKSGAEVMLKLKRTFSLKGNFTKLDTLMLVGNQHKPLSSINEDLVNTGNTLLEIDDKKVLCLEEFVKCKDLVEWLRKSLEGPNQVKVLVDLAMITAYGQGDMEVQKVKCLHAAAIGYASLIYDLKPDVSFEKFLDLCKSVWRSLDSDQELPTKLRDTQRHLDWLKKVKESKGSMEMNAFAQAELINTDGIYKIGYIKNSPPKRVDDALELVIPKVMESGEREKVQTYSYQQLNDLQSKLMLVAGKAQRGKKQVDRFVEIFDGVTRMATIYIKLCNAGSILFKKWVGTFYNQPNRKVNSLINFGIAEHRIQGHTTESVDVTKQISLVCSFLDDCLQEWIHHIETKRVEFTPLNFFTTEQLVILRRELAVLCQTDRQVANSVYPMLHAVHQHCTDELLRQAAKDAFLEIQALEMAVRSVPMDDDAVHGADSVTMEDQESSDSCDDLEARAREFIVNLVESGYSEKLAKRALEAFGADSFQEAMLWCMENADESSDGTESVSSNNDDNINENFATPPQMESMDYQVEKTLEDFTTELLQHLQDTSSLTSKLKELWDNYLMTVSTSVSDYLSVEHLGHILTQLQEMSTVKRPFPTYLKVGQPNLLVCPKAQVLQVILSLYMDGDGSTKPLPGRDEVLLCSTDTNAEQVELLLRRAIHDPSNKLYCLADVGQLDYEVAQRAESYFEKHCKRKPNLRLVVICSRETEDRSHIVTFLEQFRVQYPPMYSLNEIQHYLKDKFTISHDGSAAILDPECVTVRLVKSHRAGVGKTLKVRRLKQKLEYRTQHDGPNDSLPLCVTIPIQQRQVEVSAIMNNLYKFTPDPGKHVPRIFHIDLAHEVLEGVDHLLFNLLVLGSVMDKDGKVWQRYDDDLYIVESMPLLQREVTRQGDGETVTYVHHVLQLLPSLTCWSPLECLLILNNQTNEMLTRYPKWTRNDNDQLMDDGQFRSETFQRPYQYLKRYRKNANLLDVNPARTEDDQKACLQVLMMYCGIRDPSWAELSHFVHFLNIQLRDCERSDFCQFPDMEQDLPGFRLFVVKFMINMSRDFATRSLNISEQTPGMAVQDNMEPEEDGEDDLVPYIIKRRWETSPHPYVFFNGDPHTEARHSMTFLGFHVSPNGDIVDPQTQTVLDTAVILRPLQDALKRNRVPLNENFDLLPRDQKIVRLSMVMGIDMPHDPDPTYELTTDNIKKILAIHMRFRCEIPVVVMGETGCGKTRLVRFMCDIQKPPGAVIQNLILMKVHGGTTEEDIIRKVNEAGQKSKKNREQFADIETVLFFDEANTTDAIGLIKEIMCDRSMRGQPLPNYTGLKFVVACNPYRKHSDEVILKLEQAGLGYHVKADETRDRLGRIPMRQLVYRVHALPQSMLPLVWDFGQLSANIEELYIRQMVQRYVNIGRLPNVPGMIPVISAVLSASQEFMKNQEDECSFVSLRDVDRVLQVMAWFFEHRDNIFPRNNTGNQPGVAAIDDDDDDDDVEEDMGNEDVSMPTRILILALGVCYHACLQKRAEYRQHVSQMFRPPLELPDGPETIAEEINRCQEVFLDKIELGPNIARNQALKENLFMMIICVELRIPLFLVGKPGSSKSLAKTIVDDAMQGDAAHHELFRHLKQVHMISFQCSPLSTPDGIVATFRQCAQLQDKKDLDRYVAVVVLDEVGLAEDSPLMPLKTLHPLLEDGCEGDEEPAPHKKVACIAISNWALDPAKMNRGIHVQRSVPDIDELKESARGICSTDDAVQARIDNLVQPLAEGYLKLYQLAITEKREFFGLRDFYSLMKMVYSFSEKSDKKPTWYQLKHAILRNFGGLDKINPADEFENLLPLDTNAERLPDDPDCSPSAMIRASLFGDGLASESRYLLILTENYAALGILQQQLLDHNNTTVIFGSSFPKDQEYTQVCRNINKIKVCMEAGRTVVLLNLENLYESLYDALNQYYVKLGDARFVDLGLGTQRVKCEVHRDFKLVVVAEKQVVYDKFPIPLINRLEKHFLAMSTMLTVHQIRIVNRLTEWAKRFATMPRQIHIYRSRGPRVHDVFVGYHVDTPASVVMHVCNVIGQDEGDRMWMDEVLERSQDLLLQCATPDSVIRLPDTDLADHAAAYSERYTNHQKHGSIKEFLQQQIGEKHHKDSGLFLQVTTHSKLLSQSEALRISKSIGFVEKNIKLSSLQAFDTEHQFSRMLRDWFGEQISDNERMLLIQCDSGNQSGDLIACARYIIQDEYSQANNLDTITHIILIIQLPRIGTGNFVGFQGGRWMCYHIDDLHSETEDLLPPLATLQEQSLATLFGEALGQKNVPMVCAVESASDSDSQDDLKHTSMDLDHTTSKHNQEEDMSQYQSDASDIVMENAEEQVIRSLPDQVREVPCRRDAGDFQMIDERFQAMNLQEVLGSARVNLERTFLRQRRGSGDAVENCLNIDVLIRKCVHKAAAMLKDYEPDTNRKTKRIQMLHKILHAQPGAVEADEAGCASVLDIINYRIYLLLKEKQESGQQTGDNWLSKNAASLESVNRAGTFRQALKQYVESKVTPLLAGLIAYADRNRNMDLIADDNRQSWIHQLWILMLLNPDITQLINSDLQTVTTVRDGTNLTEFRVETSGYNKTLFSALLPFSWVIYHQVDMLVYQAKSRPAKQDPEMMVEDLLQKTAMGSILKVVSNMGHMNDFIEMYLYDFVHMMYKPHSSSEDIELQLIIKGTREAHTEYRRRNDGHPLPERHLDENVTEAHLTLSSIHLVYSQIQRRLHLCTQALQVWPAAVDKCIELTSGTDVPELFAVKDELTLDIQILYLFLNELNLDKNFDDKEHKKYRAEWIKKVDRFRPTIERILNTVEETRESDSQYGPVCHRFYKTCMHLWTRVLTVYLFVQHICPPKMTEKTSKLYKCLPLWNILKDKADLKTEKCLTCVEKFLVSCNKIAKGMYFEKKKCKHCTEVLDNPVQLPCKHSICWKCVQELRDLKQLICPDCKKEIPEDIDLKPPPGKEKEVIEHNEYKQRCNTFFMELVSRLCFHGSTPPEPGVIKQLMNYVTCEHKMTIDAGQKQGGGNTRRLTPFKDGIDPTPVVRSFLLQLLLRSNIDDVREHLKDFLKRYHGLLTDSDQIMELCRLCVHCLEDHYFNEANKRNSASDRAHYIRHLLDHSLRPLTSQGLDINKLESIASTRFSLIEVCRLMHDKYTERNDVNVTDRELWRLFEAARKMCICGPPEQISQTSLYLMKQIFRQYGRPVLQELGAQPNLQWVIPPPARNQQDDVRPDRYVSLGDDYIKVRDMISEVILGRNIIDLGQLLQNQHCVKVVKERNLLLAIYIEITNSLHKPQDEKPSDQVLAAFGNYFLNDHRIHQQDLLRQLLANQLADKCGHLTVVANQNAQHVELVELLLHYWIVMDRTEANKLSEPLRRLVQNPQDMMQSYLPTMPGDHLEEVRNALLEARNNVRGADQNPVMWQCPNGHPYVIGDCGRPATTGRCNVCGQAIGGTGYKASVGNLQLQQRQNRTSPGHILGRAQQRVNAPVPERLNATTNSILRMLVHMSMYLGANRDSQNVSALVRQPAQVNDISDFLWQHLTLDLDIVAKALGKNPEDTAVFMHLMFDRLISLQAPGLGKLGNKLSSTNDRHAWEENFTQHYIAPVLKDFNQTLQETNNRIAQDNRLGNDPLLKALYEVDIGEVREVNVDNIEQEKSVWSFRARITVEHLTQEFQKSTEQPQGGARAKKQDMKLLELFLQEEHHLRILRCLPGIVRLQRILSQKFHRNIDSADATKMTIAGFKQHHIEEHLREEFEDMISNFGEAWEMLRGEIGTFAVGGSTVQADYCEQPLDDHSNLAMLLPTHRGQGLCATTLVHYMVNIHNNFMENYCKITKQSLADPINSQDVTQAHLVSYHLDRDLLPIILANCGYTLTTGQATTIDYDFSGMEKQIEDRFMRGRPRIEADVPIIVFREDFTDAAVFAQLQMKIQQDSLAGSLQQQICGLLRHLTDLNDSLATLDITIGFLVSVGGDPDMLLLDFIRGTLKMESGPLGRAAQKCGLRHTEALWLLLAHQRAKLLSAGEQDAFDLLPAGYHDDLEGDAPDELLTYFRHLTHLDLFLSRLYECIILHIAKKPENPNAEDYVDNKNQPLGFVLDEYLSVRDYPELPGLTDGGFPADVCVKHCVATWKQALHVSTNLRR